MVQHRIGMGPKQRELCRFLNALKCQFQIIVPQQPRDLTLKEVSSNHVVISWR